MTMPEIDEANRMKPLCYDPARGKFILYDEIISGKEKIVPIDTLSDDDVKRLVIERLRVGPDFTAWDLNGRRLSRDEVIRAVERDEPFGQITLGGDKSSLRDLLGKVERNL